MRELLVAAACLGLCACAAEPADYVPVASTVTVSARDRALAECRAQSDQSASAQAAYANPFYAAAAQQQFVNDCMAAKGYRPR